MATCWAIYVKSASNGRGTGTPHTGDVRVAYKGLYEEKFLVYRSDLSQSVRKAVDTAPRQEVHLEQKDIEYFRTLLTGMLEEAQHKGDSTIEDLTDSNELFADPADRASAESDRAFTLRIRDRERRLIRKIQAALQRIDDGTYGLCEDCGEESSIARLKARPGTKLCINCKSRQEEGEDIRGE